jgi:5-methylcytosine-specific restriction endonuclease McrA
MKSHRHHGRLANSGITSMSLRSLLSQQKFKCAISGRDLSPSNASLDHKQSLAEGGKHTIGNIWIVDHQVNIAKGTMSYGDFVAMCRDVVAYADVAAFQIDNPTPTSPDLFDSSK